MTACLALLLALLDDPARRVTLREPSWRTGEISVKARLLVVAEIVPADPLQDVWIEFRGRGRDWDRRDIPPSHQLRLSSRSSVAAVAVEPRSIPGLQAGEEFELRLRALYRDGEVHGSEPLVIRVAEPERREAGLLDRLAGCRQHLQGLLDGLEEDHRKISRVERSTDAESLDRAGLVQLEALEVRWTGRLRAIHAASDDLLSILEETATDQLVDPAGEARYRKTVVRLRACGSKTGPLDDLIRARRAASREALRSALDSEDRFIGRIRTLLAELDLWHSRLELRREFRSLLQEQKGINGEVERRLDRK